jgi:hypothetical protein
MIISPTRAGASTYSSLLVCLDANSLPGQLYSIAAQLPSGLLGETLKALCHAIGFE